MTQSPTPVAPPPGVVVLVSGSGTLLQALIDARPGGTGARNTAAGNTAAGGTGARNTAAGNTDAGNTEAGTAHGDPAPAYRLRGVVSDRPDALGLARARAAGLPVAVVRPVDFPDRAAWDRGVTRAVAVFSPDLVVLAGFMRLLGAAFLDEFGGRTVNTHPALLPAFPGAHGVRDALAYGVKVTGCSVILIDDGEDTGPVLDQRAVRVLEGDDEQRLHERIKVVEREMLVDVVTRMSRNGWTVTGRKVVLHG